MQENSRSNAGNGVPRDVRVDSSDSWPVSTTFVAFDRLLFARERHVHG